MTSGFLTALIVCLVIILFFSLSFLFIKRELSRAPFGWEDETGFHEVKNNKEDNNEK